MSAREKQTCDAAVITNDGDLFELISLLLDELGYSSYKTPESAPAQPRLVIVDLDSLSAPPSPPPDQSSRPAHIGVTAREGWHTEQTKSAFDAIICRPFSFSDFRCLVGEVCRQVGRRSVTTVAGPGSLVLELDSATRRVSFENSSTHLTPNEFLLLSHLAAHRGETVTRGELTALIDTGGKGSNNSNIADVYICTLRAKLEEAFGAKLIHTVRGRGYMI